MLVGGNAELMTQESTSFHASQSWSHGVTPLRHEHDERQRLRGLVQQVLRKTGDGSETLDHSPFQRPDQRLVLTSKCVTMASISSSQNGGLASNEPLTGQKDRKGLKHMPDCYAGTGRVDRLCSVQLCHLTLWTRRSRRYQGRRSKTV